MRYERLTFLLDGKIYYEGYHNLLVSRLYDLEDKIESGELVNVCDYIHEERANKARKIEKLEKENAALRERLEKTTLNRTIYYIASMWNDATLTRRQEVRCRTADYVCDKFVQCNGFILNWDEIYFTQEEAEARLAELKEEK